MAEFPHRRTFPHICCLASESAFKSSFNHVWILSAILCQPSIRILLCSETRPLAKDFIGVIRVLRDNAGTRITLP